MSLFGSYSSFAQSKGEMTQSRILILLDESSSMIQKWPSGKEKYKAADELILRLMDSIYAINRNVEFSLRVFGHQYTIEQKNCYDTKNEVAFSKDNRVQMSLRLEDIRPLGVTPISYALMQAAQYDLVDEERNAYSIILITDGGESCGGDICEVMKKLLKYKVYFKPYIVSLEDDPTLKVTYSCMGDYLQVTKDSDMPVAVSTIVKAFRPLISITKADYKEIKNIAANAPSVLKVSIPEIKMAESDTKKPEPPVKPVKPVIDTIPVVKAKDTVAKPVSKIKVDEVPAKLPQVKIPALPVSHSNLFYTAAPVLKTINAAQLPPTNIAAPLLGEEISTLPIAQGKPFSIQPPVLKEVKATDRLPTVSIVVKDEPEHISGLTLSRPAQLSVAVPQPLARLAPHALPVPEMQIPSSLAPERINHLPVSKPRLLATTTPSLKMLKPVQPATVVLPPVVIDTVAVVPKLKTDKAERLALAAFKHIQILIVIEEKSIVPVKLPPLPPLKIEIPQSPVTKAPAPANVPEDGSKPADYTVEQEDAKETSVEVYLTNGKGKFYSTTPQMLALDPATKKIVKAFYRTVDASGNPDAITDFPPGNYNISLSTRRSLEVKNVSVERGKKTKITVIVKPCSLSFRYEKAPSRPVVEFSARVIERNKSQGKITDQRCNERLEYAPGNYHIMINTFPQIDRNADIEFDELAIDIPQPGFAKFIADPNLKTAELYKQEGDKFLMFHTLDVTEAVKHPVRIQPGIYQVHYHKSKGAPDVVVTFLIKATEETSIELNTK